MLDRLKNFLAPLTKEGIALAYSGGTDSSLLLAVLQIMHKEQPFPLMAVYIHSIFQPPAELEQIHKFAQKSGIDIKIVNYNPLEIAELKNNPPDRCYWCKSHICAKIRTLANQESIKTVIDGTNADDRKSYRPGLRALKEQQIISPLAETGFTKAEIRCLARELKLECADKPSSPCMATRFEYGSNLTAEEIKRVSEGEILIKSILPYSANVRLRVHGKIARIEVDAPAIPILAQQHSKITQELKSLGFKFITLDLEGFRSGSMDKKS